jgi:hypothetical protein
MNVTIVNDTPLELRLRLPPGNAPATLKPYGRYEWPGKAGQSVLCQHDASKSTIAKFQLDDVTSSLHVTAANLRGATAKSRQSGRPVALEFTNTTDWRVDLFTLDDQGIEKMQHQGVPPSERVNCAAVRTKERDVWVARASFTGELLGLHIVGGGPKEQFTITAERRPNLPPLVAGYPNLETIGDVRETPGRESKQYIAISVRKLPPLPPKESFNTQRNVVLRAVTVAGVRVTWTKESGLLAYQGEGANDIREMVIYADELVVRAPIRLPGTNVRIVARELVFAGDGCIDTTPVALLTKAESANKVKIGDVEVPANAEGQPTWKGKDGEHGEKAGDITLIVGSIRQDKAGPPRLIARGSKGQDAEEGGRKPYAPRPGQSNRPPAEHGKNLKPVTAEAIKNFIGKKFIESRVNFWCWPGGQWWPENVAMENDALNKGKVTHVKLIGYDDTLGMGPITVSWLPSEKHRRSAAGPERGNLAELMIGGTDDTRLRPGDGEDAYPSGSPGNGGQGGRVISMLASAPLSTLTVVTKGGAPGEPTKEVIGGDQGTPVPAYWATFTIVKYTDIESPRQPAFSLEKVTAEKGSKAESNTGKDGKDGDIESQTGTTAAWLHPTILNCVLACASDAYRNGQRAEARRLLEPYYVELRRARSAGTLSNELVGQFLTIDSMRVRMSNNLDYFGNPPGWLPRLNLISNFKIFQDMRRLASEVLYYSDKALQDYEKLDSTGELVSRTSDALGRQMMVAGALLQSKYAELDTAKKALDAVLDSYKESKRDIDDLRDKAERDAENKLREQRLFKAFMKFAAGVAKAVPVGQPFVGLAGSALDAASEINWNAKDIGAEVGKGLQKFGGATATFLKDNNELLVKSAGPRAKLDSLSEQLSDAQSAIETVDVKLDGYKASIETRWSESAKAGNAAQASRITELDTTIKAKETRIAELKKKDAEAKLTQVEVGELEQAKKTFEQANATRAAYIELKEASKGTILAQKAQLEKSLEDNKAKWSKEALDALRGRLQKIDGLTREKVEVQREVEQREEKRKKLLQSLSGVGDGLSLIGEGLSAATAPISADDPEVARLTEEILKSSYKTEYENLKRKFDEMNAKKNAAVLEVARHQQVISACTAQIATNLNEMTALSQQQQSLDGVLDVAVKGYLLGMSQRAKDTLHWSIYHLTKAWQYEYMTDVPDNFYNFATWMVQLRAFAAESNKLLGKEDFEQKSYEAVEKAALTDQFIGLAKQIIGTRQSLQSAVQNVKDVLLSKTHLDALNSTGCVTFNLVRDYELGSFNDIDKRIIDIRMRTFTVEKPPPHLSLDIRFIHSGESVLLRKSRDEKTGGARYGYYWFRAASGDDPVSWGFTYNAAYVKKKDSDTDSDTDSDGDDSKVESKLGIQQDKKDSERRKQESELLKSMLGTDEKIEYNEYFPSFFSDITLRLNPGHFKPKVLPQIQDLSFKVIFSYSGTRI